MVVLFAVAAGDGGGGNDITNAAPSLAQRNWTSPKRFAPLFSPSVFRFDMAVLEVDQSTLHFFHKNKVKVQLASDGSGSATCCRESSTK